ncbi:MAG: C39 family peptidase [Thermomicrobiales bacterium]
MRRTVTRALLIGGLAAGLCSPFVTPAAMAQDASVEAWATISATHPAPGCSVGVSFEVRSGGAASAGADVSMALSVDGTSDVISSDREVTDGSGIAALSFDTSGAGAGDKLWLEFHINGAYVGGETIWADGSDCGTGGKVVAYTGDVPAGSTASADTTSTDTTSASTAGASGTVMIPGISTYQQQRNLSCEYASLSIATGALGSWISEWSFDAYVPLNANPHWGYRGDINGQWGNTTDYGVYAEPLVPALQAFGFTGDVFYGGTDTLKQEIAAGHPTLVWIALWGDTSIHESTADGTSYQLTAGEHVVVAYGYDDNGVYLSDPGSGKLRYYDWGTFTWMWSVMDEMALSVHW